MLAPAQRAAAAAPFGTLLSYRNAAALTDVDLDLAGRGAATLGRAARQVQVAYGTPFSGLTPELRVTVAVTPFCVGMLARWILGRTYFTRWAVTLGTMWFAFNVLLAPYAAGIREDLSDLASYLR